MSDLPAPSKLLGEAAKPSRYNTGELARDCSALLEDLLVLEVAGKVQKGTTAAKAAEWIEIIDQKFRDEGRPVPPMPGVHLDSDRGRPAQGGHAGARGR